MANRLPLFALCLLSLAPSSLAQRPAHLKPNIELYVYRRCYTPDEKMQLRLSVFNVHQVRFAVHRLDLHALLHSSRDLENLGSKLAAANADAMPLARSWLHVIDREYPNQWRERAVDVPKLGPGVYLVRATVAGVEKRTWFAITDLALFTKRSRQELLVYAADARSGRPAAGLQLAVLDEAAGRRAGSTNPEGIWRTASGASVRPAAAGSADTHGNLWIYGERDGKPVFVLSGLPAPPEPLTVYGFTDRPVYRPGHKVQFKGIVRERLESANPGGFVYRPYAEKPVVVEIRDATDALVYRREMTTNGQGSYSGDLQLAGEPTLGPWQIVTTIGGRRCYSAFKVLAYRKPEFVASVRFEKPHYLGGETVPVTIDARYYFGQPVVGAAVRYTVSGDASGVQRQELGVTDAKGQLHLDVRTRKTPQDATLTVSATITDSSRRSQQASGSTLIAAAQFRLGVQADRYIYHPGDTVTAEVSTVDYDGKPLSTKVRVYLVETLQDRDHRWYEQRTERLTTTDARGKSSVQFRLPRPGYLRLEAQAYDSQDNKVIAQGYVWVAGEEYGYYDYQPLSLTSDRPTYRPGETATLLVNTSLVAAKGAAEEAKDQKRTVGRYAVPPAKEVWALLTVEGERLYEHRLIRLTSRTTSLQLPVRDAYFPAVNVSLTILRERYVYSQSIRLSVPLDDKRLAVSVAPDRDHYGPGEKATYTVTTRDHLGRPVAAEVALGVVDASLYAVQPDETPDPFGFFYSGQQDRVETDFSFAAQYSGGAYQNVPSPPSGAATQEGIRIRRNFADTAYWNPVVSTGPDGAAKLSFDMPDNLTTWRATARGITAETAVGQGTSDVVSSMPFLVRLEMPRFYVQGDQAVISAVVHNYTGAQRTVKARIEAPGLTLTEPADRTLTLASDSQQRLDWRARVNTAPSGKPGFAAPPLRVLVVADGGEGARDATELTLPVSPNGLKQVDATAETLDGASARRDIDLTRLPAGSSVTLTLSPSIASAVFDALNELTSFPYGCAEQTMSSFLPDVAVSRAFKKLGVQRPVHPDLERWVNVGLQKLYRYQHADGGWHWWEFDQTDGDMTAYVLWGLIQARDAGYLVDDQRILRGTDCMLRLLAAEKDPNTRAGWTLALAYARPAEVAPALAQLFAKREQLDTYGLATLGLALAKAGSGGWAPANAQSPGPAELAKLAAVAARELEVRAVAQGTTAHWRAELSMYSWRGDDADVTARALRALLAVTPDSPRVQPAVRWLMGNRQGAAWRDTQTSAEAVYALAAYMEHTKELHPRFSATVALDGQPLRTLQGNDQTALDRPATVTLSAEQLAGHKALTVERDGTGPLYLTTTVSYLVPPEQVRPGAKGIEVRRTFRIATEDPDRAAVPSGQEMEVTVEITAADDYKHVILEDPIPAGCEVAPTDDLGGRFAYGWEAGGSWWARQEVRDNRVVYFFDELRKGKTTLTYRMYAETPGRYHILPSIASLMYFPEIRGNGRLATVTVGEREEQ